VVCPRKGRRARSRFRRLGNCRWWWRRIGIGWCRSRRRERYWCPNRRGTIWRCIWRREEDLDARNGKDAVRGLSTGAVEGGDGVAAGVDAEDGVVESHIAEFGAAGEDGAGSPAAPAGAAPVPEPGMLVGLLMTLPWSV